MSDRIIVCKYRVSITIFYCWRRLSSVDLIILHLLWNARWYRIRWVGAVLDAKLVSTHLSHERNLHKCLPRHDCSLCADFSTAQSVVFAHQCWCVCVCVRCDCMNKWNRNCGAIPINWHSEDLRRAHAKRLQAVYSCFIFALSTLFRGIFDLADRIGQLTAENVIMACYWLACRCFMSAMISCLS